MAAGDALVLRDDFNRANGAIGANWSALFSGFGQLTISSNAAIGTFSGLLSYWNGATFGPDVEVAIDVVGTNPPLWVYLRMINPGGASVSGYECGYDGSNWMIARVTNAVFTTIATVSGSLASGDKLMGRAVGSTIEVYQFTGGSWVLRTSVTDATYSAAGYAGIESDSTGGADAFYAGTISGAAAAPSQLMLMGVG